MSGRHPASFRDPAGFVFSRDGVLYRQVNTGYLPTYEAVNESGLYEALVGEGLLVRHAEAAVEPYDPSLSATVLEPERVPFVSHPYEWCPGQLREAALVTLQTQLVALDHGFTLKDASAFNVQFVRGRAVLIDTLSFERYVPGSAWAPYGQFCRHFLAPLALATYVDPRLVALSRVHLDGVPLDLAARLLPRSTRLRWGLALHLHAHGASQTRHAGGGGARGGRTVSPQAHRGLIESLRAAVTKLTWDPPRSAWRDYYPTRDSYTETSIAHKRTVVDEAVSEAARSRSVGTVWDLGANTGMFSAMAHEVTGADVVAWESDYSASELHARERPSGVLPLTVDLTNPSPGSGWRHAERASLVSRGPADLVLALALVHHLAIGNNVPLGEVLGFVADVTRSHAIVEWVPKADPMVQSMLATREDVFDTYDEGCFLAAVDEHFEVVERYDIAESQRFVLLLRRRGAGQSVE